MIITTTWSITRMEVKENYDGLEDVVFTVYYNVQSQSDGINPQTSTYNGNVVLQLPNSSQFTPFSSLNEGQVLDWVKDQLGPLQVANIQNSLTREVSYNTDPSGWITPPLPWLN